MAIVSIIIVDDNKFSEVISTFTHFDKYVSIKTTKPFVLTVWSLPDKNDIEKTENITKIKNILKLFNKPYAVFDTDSNNTNNYNFTEILGEYNIKNIVETYYKNNQIINSIIDENSKQNLKKLNELNILSLIEIIKNNYSLDNTYIKNHTTNET